MPRNSTQKKGKKTNNPSKTKDEVKKEQAVSFQIAGIIWLAIGAFLLLSMTFNVTGVVGEVVSNIGRGLLGFGAFVLCLVPVLIGIRYIMKESISKIIIKGWADLLLVLSISTIAHLICNPQFNGTGMLKKLYTSGIELTSGGILGGSIGNLLTYLFGRAGAGLIIAVTVLVSIMMGTGLTLHRMAKNIKQKNEELKTRRTNEEILKNAVTSKAKNSKFNVDIPVEDGTDLQNNKTADKQNEDKPKDSVSSDIEEIFKRVNKEQNKTEIKQTEDTEPIKKELQDNETQSGNSKKVYKYPPLTLLRKNTDTISSDASDELRKNAEKLIETLKSFGVETRLLNVSRGPSVTRYELQPSAGVKVSKIINLSDDIALNLAAPGIRIEAPIPGKAAVGIEVPNKKVMPVTLREILSTSEFKKSESAVTAALGKDIAGNSVVTDIAKMPHVLIAGATGSGKSVCINSIVTSILYKASPKEVRLLMIDPKVVELGVYNGIPHLLIPVVTDPKKAAGALNWAVTEMLNRYKLFAEAGVRDISGYNALIKDDPEKETLPRAVIIIDELADLMMAAPRDVEDAICRLAQMARAAGMYLVIATQRPSVDVITGIIKANIPSRISFAVSSQVDSRTILDMGGAEKLLGRGDMLYLPSGMAKPVRVQGCYVSDKEVEAVVKFIKKSEVASYNEDIIEHIEKNSEQESNKIDDDCDEMLPKAIETVVDAGQASVSLLQRKLRLGYARAARIVDQMEERGIVGPYEGSKPRQVLINRQQFLEMKLNNDEE